MAKENVAYAASMETAYAAALKEVKSRRAASSKRLNEVTASASKKLDAAVTALATAVQQQRDAVADFNAKRDALAVMLDAFNTDVAAERKAQAAKVQAMVATKVAAMRKEAEAEAAARRKRAEAQRRKQNESTAALFNDVAGIAELLT